MEQKFFLTHLSLENQCLHLSNVFFPTFNLLLKLPTSLYFLHVSCIQKPFSGCRSTSEERQRLHHHQAMPPSQLDKDGTDVQDKQLLWSLGSWWKWWMWGRVCGWTAAQLSSHHIGCWRLQISRTEISALLHWKFNFESPALYVTIYSSIKKERQVAHLLQSISTKCKYTSHKDNNKRQKKDRQLQIKHFWKKKSIKLTKYIHINKEISAGLPVQKKANDNDNKKKELVIEPTTLNTRWNEKSTNACE